MKTLAIAFLTTAALAAPAFAQSQGDMTLGFGIGYVEPKSDNGTLAGGATTIDGNARPTVTFEYFVRDNLGIEVLAALPFKHDINIGGSKIGTTKHLPPTVSLNYHFPTGGAFKPFAGVGINYTTFFEDRTDLGGGELKIDDSWGLAAHVGVDYALSEKAALRMDLRYIDIDSDVYLDGAKIGEVNIDPVVFGVSYVMKF
ncbi:OmpW family protein [Pseudorhodobacter turbinis]|uniref:OmpW family protein n=1 Tax=Pseudorhodobacter turbinis TaxID=2500533 RepID=A0A4P8EE24_9RHOB|nr:OmpW family outer membrane protein [Pseudorhodobacter turbinis]QCO54959.1 OmpW family protein [Pseudorhodobacter turbinis]